MRSFTGPLTLLLMLVLGCLFIPLFAAENGVEGAWYGTLKPAVGPELRIVLHIAAAPSGALAATLDSPDQGAAGIPFTKFTFDGENVSATLDSVGASFTGRRVKGGDTLTGFWTQSGTRMPLELKRSAQIPVPVRPQTPKRPYPYREEAVEYHNATAHIRLTGTLTLPKGNGPFTAVLLATGSGPQDRDETLFDHKPFLILSDYLTRRGFAVLRMDDRGMGGSTGVVALSTTSDLTDDAMLGIAYLKHRHDIDARRIGIIGHSEGALIADMAAARSKDVAFIVMMAGTGLPGDLIVPEQTRLIMKASGVSEELMRNQVEMLTRIIDIIKNEPDNGAASANIEKVVKAQIDALPPDVAKLPQAQLPAAMAQAQPLMSPWFRYFLTNDPRVYLRKVTCPVLVLNGDKDLQVAPDQNLPEIEKALKEAGNTRVTDQRFPRLNHLFQTCTTGSPIEYAQIQETLAPVVLERIAAWLATFSAH